MRRMNVSHPLRDVIVSVGLETSLWAWDVEPALGLRDEPYSSAGLVGVISDASVVREVPLPALQEEIIDSGLDCTRVLLRSRDVDGSTALVHIRGLHLVSWEAVGAAADQVVAMCHTAAGYDAAERASAGYQPVPLSGGTPPRAAWAHTTMICVHTISHEKFVPCSEAVATELLPSEYRSVELPGLVARFAFQGSLVCTTERDRALVCARLLDELHGWWNASYFLDAALSKVVRRATSIFMRDAAEELSLRKADLARVSALIGVLQCRLDTFKISLGAREWPLWTAAADKWALSDNIAGLDRKRQLLLETLASSHQLTGERQARRLNQLAGVFAVVSAIASYVAVILFVLPDLGQASGVMMRVALLLVAVSATAAMLIWAARRAGPDRSMVTRVPGGWRGAGPRQPVVRSAG